MTEVRVTLDKMKKAIEEQDKVALGQTFRKMLDICPSKNSYCFTETYCVECPMGLLKVQSGRSGLYE